MPRVTRSFHSAEAKARREAEVLAYKRSLPWVQASASLPANEVGFVPVRLIGGTYSSAGWDAEKREWRFGPFDPVGTVEAWSPPQRLHSCSQ